MATILQITSHFQNALKKLTLWNNNGVAEAISKFWFSTRDIDKKSERTKSLCKI